MKALRRLRHSTRSDLIRYGLHSRNPKTNESVAAHAISPLLKSILTNAGLQTMDIRLKHLSGKNRKSSSS